MPLEEYNKKRDFSKTSEPSGKEKKSEGKLKFVVQRHAASRLHYDFRLEMDGVLKSWAVPKGPSLNPDDKRLAMMTEDHPYSYRTFEGHIPEGQYGGGEVEIWDEGWYEPLTEVEGKSDDMVMQAELHKMSLKFVLHGKKLKGEFALVKIKNSEDNAWLLIKHRDEFSTEFYDAEENTDPNSKVTAYLEQKKGKKAAPKRFKNHAPALSGEKKVADFIKPMMAQLTDKAFSDPDWVFEIKWDGYRAVADLRDEEPKFYSRNGLSFMEKFRKVVRNLEKQEHKMVIDGELVAFNEDGAPDFQLLQNIGENPNLKLVYQVFDLLWLNGHSTTSLTLLERKELLKDALQEFDNIKYCDHIPENGIEFFEQSKNLKLEGIIAKKADSVYAEGRRTSDWLKIKNNQTEDVVICGFTAPKGGRKKFGALILGQYKDGELIYCGHTGTGFSDKMLAEVYEVLELLIVEKTPFKEEPLTNDDPTWVKPKLVCEIKFSEITKEGIFRHPVFMRLRDDKTIEDLQETSGDAAETSDPEAEPEPKKKSEKSEKSASQKNVKITNEDKIFWPKEGYTKGDLIDYYQSVKKYILPHIIGRPQSLHRFPNGITEMSFYQKDASEHTPDWVETVEVFSESNEKIINYIVANDSETIAYLNNLGCIELNVWTSSTDNLENPDYLVLDLDPSEKNTFEDVIEVAQYIKEISDKAKIDAYIKTSGSTGLHVYMPMNGQYGFDQVKDFAHVLMQLVIKELPEITTLERSLQKRSDKKIYLDYLQNRRGQTLASVYSVRPKPGAPVSMPLEWKEVKKGLKPTDFNIENALERIKKKGDIFLPVLGKGVDILQTLENLQNLK